MVVPALAIISVVAAGIALAVIAFGLPKSEKTK